jgi:hypothetical protein
LLGTLVAVLVALTIAAFVATATEESHLPMLQALVLIGLAMIAAHRETVFCDESAVSGSVLVVCACVVGFGASAPLVPLMCALGAVLHRDHLRSRQLRKLSVNLGATVLPALAATIVFRGLQEPAVVPTVIAIVASASTYWLFNSALVGLALALAQGRQPMVVILDLIKSDTVMLVFAVGGALCGLVMTEVGPWVGIVALAASLVALDVFVLSVPGGPSVLRSSWRMIVTRMGSGVVAGMSAAWVTDAIAAPGVGVMVGLGTGVAAGLTGMSLVAVGRSRSAGAPLDRRLLMGFAIGELPLVLIAACAGVVGAEVGAAAGFVTASVLVIVGSLASAWNRARGGAASGDDDLLLAAVTEAILDGMPESLPRR